MTGYATLAMEKCSPEGRYTMMICRICGEYMEYTGKGIDTEQRLYEMYLCIECGHEEAVAEENAEPRPSYPAWDPPDGTRSGGHR